MKNLNNLSINEKGTWAIVTKEGKIIAKFRNKLTAVSMKGHYEDKLFEELEVKKIK